MQALNPLTLPRSGIHLLEASAGTGKTYSITSIILRHLLGHNGKETQVQPVYTLEQLLIVTFTRAATAELRVRVGNRIRTARQAFESGVAPPDDELIAHLLADSRDPGQDLYCLRRAEQELDLASVFTLHGFAQRVLQEYAFESGTSFDVRLDENIQDLEEQAILDFWREQVYTLSPFEADIVLSKYDAMSFIQRVKALSGVDNLEFLGAPSMTCTELLQNLHETLVSTRQSWQAMSQTQKDSLLSLKPKKGFAFHKVLEDWQLSCDEGMAPSWDTIRLLSSEGLKENTWKKNQSVLDEIEIVHAFSTLLSIGDNLTKRLLLDALQWTQQQAANRKQLTGRLGFNDFLRLLDKAVTGPTGELLVKAIRDKYPVALMDEFQDTDPVQWRSFSKIYERADAPGSNSALYLVGDPKQAIYMFRGADVYAYIKAKRATKNQYSLTTNYRSVAGLVKATNDLFQMRRDKDPFAVALDPDNNDIPFVPALPSVLSDERLLMFGGKVVPPMQFIHLSTDRAISKGDYVEQMALSVAAHLSILLADSQLGNARIGDRNLEPSDIVILVRSNWEASIMKASLERYKIPYVNVGARSVFETVEAQDLYLILKALMDPLDGQLVSAACASNLLQMSAEELVALQDDDGAGLLAAQEHFLEISGKFVSLGPIGAVRGLLHHFNVPARLMARPGGERRLTDCLHLLELLQDEQEQSNSNNVLLRWLARQIELPPKNSEKQQLRLESDAQRVTIATLHSSKGLEYPLVYIPFAATKSEQKDAIYHDQENLHLIYDVDHAPRSMAFAAREKLSEEMRLLYVGITRAQFGCFIGIAETRVGRGSKSQLHRTPLGYLLDLDEEKTLAEVLSKLPFGEEIPVLDASGMQGQVYAGDSLVSKQYAAREVEFPLVQSWRVHSYSSLINSRHSEHADVFSQPELILQKRSENIAQLDTNANADIFEFPRGARAGTFIHSLLEEIEFTSDPAGHEAQHLIRAGLKREGYGIEWAPALTEMLRDVLACDLDGRGLKLGALTEADRIVEMGFDISLSQLDLQLLERLIVQEGASSSDITGLQRGKLAGLLTGFIDLVFVFDGRYYVVDYKSNHLGTSLDCYTPKQLELEISKHRYDLQYALYSVALHRYLSQRLGTNYSYGEHFGGVYYLFLRGIRENQGNRTGVYYHRLSTSLVEQLDEKMTGSLVC